MIDELMIGLMSNFVVTVNRSQSVVDESKLLGKNPIVKIMVVATISAIAAATRNLLKCALECVKMRHFFIDKIQGELRVKRSHRHIAVTLWTGAGCGRS